MEAKLKGMKVADLKSVLQQANVAFDSKLTKPGLIKKIMETPAAAEIVSKPDDMADDDDMPDLPPKIDWGDGPKTSTSAPISTAATTQTTTPSASVPPTKVPPPTPVTGVPPTSAAAVASSPQDKTDSAFKAEIPTVTLEDEAAKRRARAAKWGTTYNEPTVAASSTKKREPKPANVPDGTELEKRKEREARFGKLASTSSSNAAPIDDEEMRKRKAREERFGPNKKPRVDPQ